MLLFLRNESQNLTDLLRVAEVKSFEAILASLNMGSSDA